MQQKNYTLGFENEAHVRGPNKRIIPGLLEWIYRINRINGTKYLSPELGAGMIEFISPTSFNPDDAINHLATTINSAPQEWQLHFMAPSPDYDGEKIKWMDEVSRYVAILDALKKIKPNDWEGVFQFGRWCALHVNIGIDPRSYKGLVIMNTINNVAPYIAHMTREDFPESKGHLAIWRGWTDKERLPYYGEVYSSHADFALKFGKTKRLIREVGDDVWKSDLKTAQGSMDPVSLGTNWKLCRPKVNPDGVRYLEMRMLPSMSIDMMRKYVPGLLKGIDAIIDWFDPREHSVLDIDDATHAASKDSWLFPKKSLTKDQWENYFVHYFSFYFYNFLLEYLFIITMKKILSIQFRINSDTIKREQDCILREAGAYVEVDFISALDKSIDWNFPETIMEGYEGVILGGTGDLDFDGGRDDADEAKRISYELLGQLRPLFNYIFDRDIPTLGICYGHQILGAFAGAQVCCDHIQKKSRSHEVKLMIDKNDYFLFSDLPDSFHAHYGHKDVLDRVPEGAVLLMNGGDECKVSALRYKNNIYTVQFHPELNFGDMVERIKNSPGYLPEGTTAEEVFKDDPESNKILQNFGKMVAMREVSVVSGVPEEIGELTKA